MGQVRPSGPITAVACIEMPPRGSGPNSIAVAPCLARQRAAQGGKLWAQRVGHGGAGQSVDKRIGGLPGERGGGDPVEVGGGGVGPGGEGEGVSKGIGGAPGCRGGGARPCWTVFAVRAGP